MNGVGFAIRKNRGESGLTSEVAGGEESSDFSRIFKAKWAAS